MHQLYRYITCAGQVVEIGVPNTTILWQSGDPLYSPARYQETLQMVVNTGIIGELDHNPRYVASFFGRIQSDAIAIARRTNPS